MTKSTNQKIKRRGILGLPLLLLGGALPAAPAGVVEAHRKRPAVQDMWARTELYFGTNRPGGAVSEAEFNCFIDDVVTPRFPDGLTLLSGYGQFLNSKGILERERSKVLILLYPATTIDASKLIQEIREAYKAAYQQESVLRVDTYVSVSF